MTLDTSALLLFVAGMGAGAGLTIQVFLLPEIISAGRLIRFYLQTRDRQRAVRLWQVDQLTRLNRRRARRRAF